MIQEKNARRSLVDADPIAHRMDISRWQLLELCRKNLVPHVRLGRRVKFDPDKIEEWIASGGQAQPDAARPASGAPK